MILYIFYFIFVACNSSAMLSAGLKALILPKKHTAVDKVDSRSKWRSQLKYIVNPSFIELIEADIVSLPAGRALAYDATLRNGDQVTCFLILEGEYKNEKWALLYKEDLPPVPIPDANFDIVKKLYQLIKNI